VLGKDNSPTPREAPQKAAHVSPRMRRILLLLVACGSTTRPARVPFETTTAAQNMPNPTSRDSGDVTPEVRFLALGDTGKGNAGQHAVAAAMARKCAADRCDFAVLLGDNIYNNGAESADDPQFKNKFEDVYAALNIDFYAVLGNHDYGGKGAGTSFAKGKNEVDYTLRSTKWKMPAAHYHFVNGNTEFFALDTNLQMFGMDAQQKTDVGAWLTASTARWKIAVGHHPYKSNGPHGNAGDYDRVPIPPISGAGVKDFFESTVCDKVDLYLCGHDHSMQWLTERCGRTTLAVSGAGAETTTLTARNPVAYATNELGFMYIVVREHTLTAEIISETGAVLSTQTLSK
jgi:tartrate-resistant acid phosphatase type 5